MAALKRVGKCCLQPIVDLAQGVIAGPMYIRSPTDFSGSPTISYFSVSCQLQVQLETMCTIFGSGPGTRRCNEEALDEEH